MRRRTVLVVAAAAVACRKTSSNWRFFTNEEARIVEAITAQLIPSGPGPGAREAGVVNYIDIQLSKRFRKHQRAYRQALANLTNFPDLPEGKQIEALNALEENTKPFFQLLLTHTRQGFYGDPRHGGNRDRISWKLLGLPTPPIRGRAS